MALKGVARVDRKTKHLTKRLQPGDIAVIDHRDIDEVSAMGLVAAHPRAVVNASECISGKYPNLGPGILLDAGIFVLDCAGPEVMTAIAEGHEAEVDEHGIWVGGHLIASGSELTRHRLDACLEAARQNLGAELDSFVENTLEFAKREKALILGGVSVPAVEADFRGKHALIVVRGKDYREDLGALRSYIRDVKPILVGVDGGADALREMGYMPHLIVGDMDSVTDATLLAGAELVVHAYPDGRAPGLERVQGLGLRATVFPAPGTSEDIAMLLAYEHGSELIVAVGTHSNMIDFLEKGRKGMASTFLVRLKCGSILVDAKGVNKLYQSAPGMRSIVVPLALAALIPLAVVVGASVPARQLFRLLLMRIRFMLGG